MSKTHPTFNLPEATLSQSTIDTLCGSTTDTLSRKSSIDFSPCIEKPQPVYTRPEGNTSQSTVDTLIDKSSIDILPCAEKPIQRLLAEGFHVTSDGKVSWTVEHRFHPRNWSLRRKIYDTGIMFFLELFTTMISNTGSLSAVHAHHDLGITKEQAIVLFTSTYLLAQAMGSIFFSPFTESYGRRVTYITSAAVFAIATALVGCGNGMAPILVGRILSGLASAVPTTVLSGSIEDMWGMEARIWAVNLWVLFAIIGVGVAPAYSTITASFLNWRWIYYIASIIAAFLVPAIALIKESRPSQVLKAYLDKHYHGLNLRPRDADIMPSFSAFARDGLKKPLALICTEPLLLVITIMSASVYGFAYLLTEQVTSIYAGFGYSEMEGAMVYLALCGGAILALLMRFLDSRKATRRAKAGKELTPEDKLTGFFVAAPLQALAFWVFAWTIPPFGSKFSSLISVFAIVPIGFAMNEFDHVLLGYIVDSYTSVAGSACAPLGALRAILSALLPLAGLKMFNKLGNNLGVSVVAIIASLYVGFAVAFYFFGARLRQRSRYGRGLTAWKELEAMAIASSTTLGDEEKK